MFTSRDIKELALLQLKMLKPILDIDNLNVSLTVFGIVEFTYCNEILQETDWSD